MTFSPETITAFHLVASEIDPQAGEVRLRYRLDDEVAFCERIAVPGADPAAWEHPAVAECVRLLHLLAGVSYYKAAAPPRIDLGPTPLREGERAFLRGFYLDGLGEYAYVNGLDLSGLDIVGGVDAGPVPAWPVAPLERPLIPFGGGMDSIVTVEALRGAADDPALFIMGRRGTRYEAIEDAAAVADLPIVRADQTLDPQILRSAELGFRNGHVPITGVLSMMALLVAALHGRGAVVMSNEWSASIGNLEVGGRTVNHQYSKSWAFEEALRGALAGAFDPAPEYFSYLRPYSELWIARRFAELTRYHRVFRSCNRAFHIDPAARLDRWCGRCDKCAFIDLILAPYLPAAELDAIFSGEEPLANPALAPAFRSLLGTSSDRKPFECVGEEEECRIAALLAAQRDDRADAALLQQLAAEIPEGASARRGDVAAHLQPMGPTNTPDALAG
jgi:UDP-N-acetyl-alpha-D-muramoyl-L-alanyl-L-glutamate epimerase